MTMPTLLTAMLLAGCADEQPNGNADTSAVNSGATAATSPVEEHANGGSGNGASAATAAASNGRRISDGQWFTKTHRERPWAGFGPPYSEAAFSARCEREQLVFNTTEMPPSGPGQTQMRLSFGGRTQALSATASEQGLPSTDAAVPADAEWLQSLASASGDLTMTVGGSDPLSVPISEPLTSLILDCAEAPSA